MVAAAIGFPCSYTPNTATASAMLNSGPFGVQAFSGSGDGQGKWQGGSENQAGPIYTPHHHHHLHGLFDSSTVFLLFKGSGSGWDRQWGGSSRQQQAGIFTHTTVGTIIAPSSSSGGRECENGMCPASAASPHPTLSTHTPNGLNTAITAKQPEL